MILKNDDLSNVQNDLDKLLLQVQRELKKKMFPRKHRKLLQRKVKVEVKELENKEVLAHYEPIFEDEKKNKLIHKIVINKEVYNEYKNGIYGLGIYKRYCKKRIKQTIAHELIHAYVYEQYEWYGDKYGFHKDGSPIFLSILTFLNIPSGHETMRAFKHTKIYEKVRQYNDFQSLERYLINLLLQYEKEFMSLETIILKDNKKVCINEFEFSNGKITGIKGEYTAVSMEDGYIGKANLFTIGANFSVENLENSIISKIERNAFERKYILPYGNSIDEKRNTIKLQSMNV